MGDGTQDVKNEPKERHYNGVNGNRVIAQHKTSRTRYCKEIAIPIAYGGTVDYLTGFFRDQ